jgi:hypothetical protein
MFESKSSTERQCLDCDSTNIEFTGIGDYYYDNEEISPDLDAVWYYRCKNCDCEMQEAFGDYDYA